MKLFRKTFSLLMVLALLMSMTVSVLAVDIATADEFYEAYGNQETDFNLTDDIESVWFEAQEGTSYVIGSEDGYALTSVGIFGAGNVEINTDIKGLYVDDSANVTVNGDITGIDNEYVGEEYAQGGTALNAWSNSTVVVNGDITGGNAEGENQAVGGEAVAVHDNAQVTVNGNVTGGSAQGDIHAGGGSGVYTFSFEEDTTPVIVINGTATGGDAVADEYAYAGSGASVYGDSTVVINGDSIGGNAEAPLEAGGGSGAVAIGYDGGTPSLTVDGNAVGGNGDGGMYAYGGIGAEVGGAGQITVTGDAVGGKASEAEEYSVGVPGAAAFGMVGSEAGSLTVEGTVKSGEGEDTYADLIIEAAYDPENPDAEAAVPEISIGACESVEIDGFTEEQTAEILENVNVTTGEEEPEPEVNYDSLWGYLMVAISKAKAGEELTTNAETREFMPSAVIDYVRNHDVKLIIKWSGGDDLVITKDFTAELGEFVLLTDLAEMLKK